MLAGFILFLFPLASSAQQTIFNVPSADVAQWREIFLQHESQFRPWDPGAFWGGTHYVSLGVGANTEIDATLFNTSAPASNNISLGIGFKTVLPLLSQEFPKQELKLTVGQLVPIGLEGNDIGSWTYGHLSFKLPKVNTRLTAGVSYGTRQIFGRDAVAFIGGIEQPITERFSLIADYYSGTHALGFLILGASLALDHDLSLYLGYQIPNNARCGRAGLVFEVAKHIRF